jgi:SAM-dependent methyltransferase
MTNDLTCPACGGKRLFVAVQLAKIRAYRCRDCRLEVTESILLERSTPADPVVRMNSTVTSTGYKDSMIMRYGSLMDSARRLATNRLALYTQYLGKRPASIIEVGSGTGWMVKAFQELGVQSAGLEIDATLVSLAQHNGANVQLADICQLSPEPFSKHDVICSSQTLEHILYPRRAIANMTRMVHPGGLVHVDVPNSAGWGARLRRLRRGRGCWGILNPPHHQIGYYPETLQKLLENAGLEILAIMEKPTNDNVFGQAILPTGFVSRAAMLASRWLGHGYLLIGLARVSVSQDA